MDDQFWVGRLPGVGEIVYDPAVQDGNANLVRLFEIERQAFNTYSRSEISKKLSAIENSSDRLRCVEIYQDWSNQGFSSKDDVANNRNGKISESLDNRNGSALSNGRGGTMADMRAMIRGRDAEISELRRQLQELSAEQELTDEALVEALHQIMNLKEELNREKPVELLYRLSKNAAFFASSSDEQYLEVILPLEVNRELPGVLSSRVHDILSEYFLQDDQGIGLRDLILMAEESGTMDNQGIEMAQILLRQSELINQAEMGVSEESVARIMLSLYAAALLWPRLPKAELTLSEASNGRL